MKSQKSVIETQARAKAKDSTQKDSRAVKAKAPEALKRDKEKKDRHPRAAKGL